MHELIKRLCEEVKYELYYQQAQMDEEGAPVHDSPGQADLCARETLRELLKVLEKYIV